MTRFSKAARELVTFQSGPVRIKPKLKTTLLCGHIYPGSPAQHAGLEHGDILLTVNDKPAAGLGTLTQSWPLNDENVFRFLHRDSSEITVSTRLHEIGIRYERGTPAIEANFDVKKHQVEDLFALWERREWALLKKLCAEQLHHLNGTAWLMRKVSKPTLADSPAALLYGVALWETGEQRAGRKFVEDFESQYLANQTANVKALSLHYQAKMAHLAEETRKARDLNRQACRNFRFASCVEWHRTQFREEAPLTAVADSTEIRFPDLGLKALDGKSPLILSDFVAGTEPGRLNVIICLGEDRGNGPTNELLGTLRRNRALIECAFSPVLVVTESPQRPDGCDHWFTEEDEMVQSGFPLRLTLDDGSLASQVAMKASPELFLVDQRGKIVYRGPWIGHHLWAALGPVQSKI